MDSAIEWPHKMSYCCKFTDVVNPVTGMSGSIEVKQSCKIVKTSKTGTKNNGKYPEDCINVWREYAGGYVALPIGYARKVVANIRLRTAVPEMPSTVIRKPKVEQVDIVNLLLKHLVSDGGALLECDPGMGKTYMSLLAAFMFNLPTIIVVARVDYASQWANEATLIVPGIEDQICLMGSVSDNSTRFTATPENAKFLFIRANIINALVPAVLKRYNFVILDETQMIGTKGAIDNLLLLAGASYVVGCSATPDKPDGRERAMELFMGTATITARREREFNICLFPLNVRADESEYEALMSCGGKHRGSRSRGINATGDITIDSDNADVVDNSSHMGEYGRMEISIARHQITNHRTAILCVCLVKMFDHKVIILTKYLNQAAYLHKILTRWGITATIYSGSDKEYDGFAEVTIGITQVAMAAFDQANRPYDRRFTAGIMMQSLAQDGNMWQAVGRVMRAPPEVRPLFIWMQYPMNAYQKHVNGIVPFLIERSAALVEPTTFIPPDIYDSFFDESVEVPICMSAKSAEDITQGLLHGGTCNVVSITGPKISPVSDAVTRNRRITVGKFDINDTHVLPLTNFFNRDVHGKYFVKL